MSPKKKKKRPCHCLRLIHVGLLVTAIVIIGAVIAPLTLIKSSRDNEFAIFGYHFDYTKRILDIYPWTDASHLLSHVDVIFKVGWISHYSISKSAQWFERRVFTTQESKVLGLKPTVVY